MCFVQSQYKGGGLRPPPFVASFVVALKKTHVLALNTAHVLRLNKADVLALNKAHVLRLNTKICPVFKANTKETTKGGRPKAAPPLWRRPKAASFMDGCLGAGEATNEANAFKMDSYGAWGIIFNRGKLFSTVGNDFPPWVDPSKLTRYWGH